MTMPACGCSRPSPDAYLCRSCTRELRNTLILAASIATDLYDAVARQLTRGDGMRHAGKPEPPLPVDLTAMTARIRLIRTLNTWTATITGRTITTVAGGSITLIAHLEQLRQHQAAWHAATAITAAVMDAVAIIDRRPDLRPAGECDNCSAPLRAEPSADTAICKCGHVTTGIAQRRAERAAAADLLGTATEISEQLATIGVRVAAGTIRMWASRARLTPRPGGMYAMSDVLTLVAQRDARAAS
jgi:hypothetical protein